MLQNVGADQGIHWLLMADYRRSNAWQRMLQVVVATAPHRNDKFSRRREERNAAATFLVGHFNLLANDFDLAIFAVTGNKLHIVLASRLQ